MLGAEDRPRSVAPKVPDWLFTNWPIKITALVLSAVLWAVVAAEEPTTQLVPVELQVRLPEGRTLTRSLPPVQALYAGTSRELIKLYAAPPVIRRIVPDTVTGTSYALELSPAELSSVDNANVNVQDIQPRIIVVQMDNLAQRRVQVTPRVTVRPDSGYSQFGLALAPSSVTVRGPAGLVGGIESVPTLPLELTGLAGPVRQSVPLDTSGMGMVRVSPAQVEVAVDVGPISERVLMGVPVVLPRDQAGQWESQPPAIVVTVRGRSARLARLTRDSVEAVAVFRRDDPEQVVRLNIVAPSGIQAVASPDTVVVRRRTRG